MPFPIDYHWEIMRILEVPFEDNEKVKSSLETVSNRSEVWTNQVIALVEKIKEFEGKVSDAAAGLVKVDVIEWEKGRYCPAKDYLSILKKQLAKSIGYELPKPFNPFESNNNEVTYGYGRTNKLRCNYLFRPSAWW